MLLSVIIVSYNTKALTLQTIESVLKSVQHSTPLKDKTEVWVVDNHSTDGTPEAVRTLQKKESTLHLIENSDNLGFSAANNKALAKATGKYLLFLNSDTVVLDDALDRMVKEFEKHSLDAPTAVLERTSDKLDRLGILSAQLLNPDGTSQAQGGSFPTLLSLAVHMLLLDDLPLIGKLLPSTQHTGHNSRRHTDKIFQQDWVGGTAMMTRQEVLAEIGPLDDNIFMYGEDIEFCMRARFHHWDVAVLPLAKITHFGSASSSSRNAIIGELKGYLYIWAKHKPIWQKGVAKWLIQLGVLLRIVLFGTMIRDTHRAAIYREARQVVRSL